MQDYKSNLNSGIKSKTIFRKFKPLINRLKSRKFEISIEEYKSKLSLSISGKDNKMFRHLIKMARNDDKYLKAILGYDFSKFKVAPPKWPSFLYLASSEANVYQVKQILKLLNKSNLTKQQKQDYINAQNPETGWTALMRAAYCNHYNIVKLLIKNGANLDLNKTNGMNALFLLALYYPAGEDKYLERAKTFKLLIDSGADLDVQENLGSTLLSKLIKQSDKYFSKERVKLFFNLLLDAEPNPFLVDCNGHNAFDIARFNDMTPEFLKLIKDYMLSREEYDFVNSLNRQQKRLILTDSKTFNSIYELYPLLMDCNVSGVSMYFSQI